MSGDGPAPMTRQAETHLRKWAREHRPDLLTYEAVEAARAEWRKQRNRERVHRWQKENPEKYAEYQRRYQEENAEQIAERKRRWEEENAEHVAERKRRWREENPEKYAEYHRRYRGENAEQIAERKRRWREENAEHVAEQNRRYHEANREARLERMRRWREQHPDYDRRWRGENAEQIAERMRRWREENAEKYAEYKHQRRVRKAAGVSRRWRVHDIPDDRCYWCGDYIGPTTTHVDHVWPIARGGAHEPENTVNTCPLCNISKRAMTPLAWIASMFDESTPTGDRLRQRDL